MDYLREVVNYYTMTKSTKGEKSKMREDENTMLSYSDFIYEVLNSLNSSVHNNTLSFEIGHSNRSVNNQTLKIVSKESLYTPTFDFIDLYTEYKRTGNVQDVVDILMNGEIEKRLNRYSFLKDINSAKEYVLNNSIVGLENSNFNTNNKCCRLNNDYNVMEVIKIEFDNEYAYISDNMLAQLGIEQADLFEIALANTRLKYPIKIEGDMNHSTFCISNGNKKCGASVLLYKDVLSDIERKIGSFYILPISKEEILVANNNTGLTPDILEDILYDSNREISDEECLSNSIYRFDNNKISLSKSDSTKEREYRR